jgi:hypothetical protein
MEYTVTVLTRAPPLDPLHSQINPIYATPYYLRPMLIFFKTYLLQVVSVL